MGVEGLNSLSLYFALLLLTYIPLYTVTRTPLADVTFSTCRLAFNYRPVSGPFSLVAARP